MEDWLKLLDYEPENVVTLKPIRPGFTRQNAKRARRDLIEDNGKRSIVVMLRFLFIMGLFNFLRRPEPDVGPQNFELLAALKIEKVAPSIAGRANLLRVLSRSVVLVAVRDLPPELRGEGPFVLKEDLRLMISHFNESGRKNGCADFF